MKRFFAERLAAEIERALGEILLYEARDERLQEVRVLRVEVSGHKAVVFYGVEGVSWSQADEALRRASGFLRARLQEELGLAYVPKLIFLPEEPEWTGS